MSIRFQSIYFSTLILCSCNSSSDGKIEQHQTKDTLSSPYYLLGNAVDSVFLFVDYMDQGIGFGEKENCENQRVNSEEVVTKGQVDTRIPGTYTLSYSVRNKTGLLLPLFTRTVHVINNSSTFLNGTYKASCTCTAITQGASSPTVTSANYTAMVSSSSLRDEFALSHLKIGPLSVMTTPLLAGDSLKLDYFSPDYHQMAYYKGSGTLLRAKNTFSIRTEVKPYDPKITYNCINSYTKQLVIEQEEKKQK